MWVSQAVTLASSNFKLQSKTKSPSNGAFLWVNSVMEDYEISSSLDWNRVKTLLFNSKKSVKIFSSDIDRMIKNIEKEVAILGNLEVIARNKKTASAIKTAQLQLDKVNLAIKHFNKYYMLALLTHE